MFLDIRLLGEILNTLVQMGRGRVKNGFMLDWSMNVLNWSMMNLLVLMMMVNRAESGLCANNLVLLVMVVLLMLLVVLVMLMMLMTTRAQDDLLTNNLMLLVNTMRALDGNWKALGMLMVATRANNHLFSVRGDGIGLSWDIAAVGNWVSVNVVTMDN